MILRFGYTGEHPTWLTGKVAKALLTAIKYLSGLGQASLLSVQSLAGHVEDYPLIFFVLGYLLLHNINKQ